MKKYLTFLALALVLWYSVNHKSVFSQQIVIEDSIISHTPDIHGVYYVPKFDKLEIEVQIPDSLITDINTFIARDYFDSNGDPMNPRPKPGTGKYDDQFKGDSLPSIINPYDPEHISVEAIFTNRSSNRQRKV